MNIKGISADPIPGLGCFEITGEVSSEFTPLAHAFEELHRTGIDSGAEVCVYVDGAQRAHLLSRERAPDRLQNVRSVSKAILSVLVHSLHERGVIDIEAPVSDIWPEFSEEGKHALSLRLLLSHQAGLVGVDRQLSIHDVLSWEPAVDALARQRPYWEPGTDHGYHDLTFGWGVGEYLRRATGLPVGQLVRRELGQPLGLDLWIGIDPAMVGQIMPFRQAEPQSGRTATDVVNLLEDKTSLFYRSQMNPNVSGIENTYPYLRAAVPGCNAVTNARSLARLFAATMTAVDGVRLWGPTTLREAGRLRMRRPDRVFGRERAYATGFMLPDPNLPQAGLEFDSFGHYGQDCSLVFVVPEHSLAFAYTSTQLNSRLDQYARFDHRATRLAAAAVEAALSQKS
ncbi:esterase [Streptomyces sp. PRh5]|uniref:serine hydrolase domain-containing protein n=1 Tax=Streptomyces sp. PRh5 TaxID=1158056 RepID=UPI000448F20D|nr:serine hydrolase domain-containing protein [Streptomyces sp. PRh5]EXU64821.1 esterase [Streptomyces sp. PRh5]